MIADDKVPQRLKDKRLISLELGMLVADTKYRGEFEERLKNVVEEVTSSNPNPNPNPTRSRVRSGSRCARTSLTSKCGMGGASTRVSW